MLKACLLAFLSGILFFFLILRSAWWLIPGVLTWTAIFIWQDRQESTRASAKASEPTAKDATEGRAGGAGRRSGENDGTQLLRRARGIDTDSNKKTGVNQ